MNFTRKTKIMTGLLCAGIYAIPLLTINGALDIFLKGSGTTPFAKGEVTTKGYEGWIEIASFSIGGSNPTTISSTGVIAGKVSMSSLSVMKRVDSLSPSFFGEMMAGQQQDEMYLLFRTTTYPGYQVKITLTGAYVESVQWSGSSGSDSGYESVSLAYTTILIEYYPVDASGVPASSPTNTAYYNLAKATT